MKINYSRNEVIANEKGYRVKDDGSVIGMKGNPLKLGKMPSDYWYFTIRHTNGNTINIAVHRLQAYQKYGDKIFDDGMVVRHLDGNHLNNEITNIEIGTQTDNIMDIPKDVRTKRSKSANRTPYPIELINEMILFYNDGKNGVTLKQTLDKFNMSSVGRLRNIFKKYS